MVFEQGSKAMKKEDIKKFLDKELGKRMKTIKEGKDRRTPEGAIKRFMLEIDKVRLNAVDAADFYISLEQEGRLLDDAVHRIDPSATVAILWANSPDKEESWKDLMLEAVHIKWSETFVKANPKEKQEIYVSYISMMLENMI